MTVYKLPAERRRVSVFPNEKGLVRDSFNITWTYTTQGGHEDLAVSVSFPEEWSSTEEWSELLPE